MRPWRVTCSEHGTAPVEGCGQCRMAFSLDVGIVGADFVTATGRLVVGRIQIGPAQEANR